MNFIKKISLAALPILFTISLSACADRKVQDDSNADHMGHADKTKSTSVTSVEVSKEQAQKILAAYFEVKDALVQTNGDNASKAAKQLLESLGDNPDELLAQIRVDAQHIADTQDSGHQRGHFNTLSDNVYAMIKATEANESTIYHQYCPMARDGQGAYWLAAEKEVNNPYFGDKMLHCGSVKEEL